MKKTAIFLISFLFLATTYSQKYSPKGGKYGGKKTKYRRSSSTLKRNPTDVFPLDPDFRLSGWYAALGGAYMYPIGSSGESYTAKNTFNDTTIRYDGSYSGEPNGKLGIYAEIGWFRSFQNPTFFHFFDVGLSYRQYKGGEDFSGNVSSTFIDTLGNETLIGEQAYSSGPTYSDQLISLHASIANHFHFSRYGFVQNAIGINVDYFFGKSRSGGTLMPGLESVFPEDIQAQLNYRLGVGWKATPTLLIIPSVEVPILTVHKFEEFKSSLPYFTTRHFPILFSIRVMLLRRIGEDCVVPEYDGPSNFN